MKVLFLLSRVPYPLEKGDKLRAFNQLKILSKHHKVILVCLNAEKLHPKAKQTLAPYCEALYIIPLNKLTILWNLFRSFWDTKPFQINYFYQKQAAQKLNAIIEEHLPAHLYVQLIRTAEYVKPYAFIPNTLDYMDAFSTGIARRMAHSVPGVKALFAEEASRLKIYESGVFKHFTHKTIISEQDRELIDHPDKQEIEIVRNGVDFDFFAPQDQLKKYDLVFCGNMAYPPNVKAAKFLAEYVLPEIHRTAPETTLLIAGATPVSAVKALSSANIVVSGWMDDIRDAYAQSKVFIAPMEIGTGLQNKLLEAMAMKLPCVTSPLANKALGATVNKAVLVGDSPESYARHALRLLNDVKHRKSIADEGYSFVRNTFSWEANTKKLLDLVEQD